MKTSSYIAFWVMMFVVLTPVILGLMTEQFSYTLFALCWAAMWWVIFTRTHAGKRAFLKGYKIACSIMRGADV